MPMHYNASWSFISKRTGNINPKEVTILVNYGRKERGKTGKCYVAAEEHALLSQVSVFHPKSSSTNVTAVIQQFKSINASRISRQSSLEVLLLTSFLEFLSLPSLTCAILFSC